ncbi:MAG: stage V sporulation protein T [Lachnospiraceae bacterium]|nr:stage V sporulation protein T [Lachnospiraceae bacterium]
MKATGIVRRIDDLGRVVVPKEIRRTLRIREGDPLEIFTDREGEIILKKYSPIGELGVFAQQYAECLAQTTGHMVCVTDRDGVVAAAGGAKKEYQGKRISSELEKLIQERESRQAAAGDKKFIPFVKETAEGVYAETICPIISEGDAIGAVVLAGRDERSKMSETEQKLAATAAVFLGKQMEQ